MKETEREENIMSKKEKNMMNILGNGIFNLKINEFNRKKNCKKHFISEKSVESHKNGKNLKNSLNLSQFTNNPFQKKNQSNELIEKILEKDGKLNTKINFNSMFKNFDKNHEIEEDEFSFEEENLMKGITFELLYNSNKDDDICVKSINEQEIDNEIGKSTHKMLSFYKFEAFDTQKNKSNYLSEV